MKKIIKITLIVTLVLLLALAAVGFVFWPNLFFGSYYAGTDTEEFTKLYPKATEQIRLTPQEVFPSGNELAFKKITAIECDAGKIPAKLNPTAYDWTIYGELDYVFGRSDMLAHAYLKGCEFAIDRAATHPRFPHEDFYDAHITRQLIDDRYRETIVIWAGTDPVWQTTYQFTVKHMFTTVVLTFNVDLKEGNWETVELVLMDAVKNFSAQLQNIT